MDTTTRQTDGGRAQEQGDGYVIEVCMNIAATCVLLWFFGQVGAWAAAGFGEPDGAALFRTLAAVAGPLFWIGVALTALVAVLMQRRTTARQQGEGV